MSDMEVRPVESCTATLDTSMLVQVTDIGEPVEITIPFYIIDHPEGVALVDTGQSYELLQDPMDYGPHGAPGLVDFTDAFEMTEDQKTVHQLDDLGYSVSDVDKVIMSHLHMDHAGYIDEFPDAEIIVHHKELRYASWPDPVQWAFFQEGDIGVLRTPEFDVTPVRGRHDVFGDGRVETIPTPGHTPGHQSVKLDFDSRTVILGMDISHQRQGYENNLSTAFDWSTAEAGKTRQKIKSLAHAEDADVYINHDMGDIDKLSESSVAPD